MCLLETCRRVVNLLTFSSNFIFFMVELFYLFYRRTHSLLHLRWLTGKFTYLVMLEKFLIIFILCWWFKLCAILLHVMTMIHLLLMVLNEFLRLWNIVLIAIIRTEWVRTLKLIIVLRTLLINILILWFFLLRIVYRLC